MNQNFVKIILPLFILTVLLYGLWLALSPRDTSNTGDVRMIGGKVPSFSLSTLSGDDVLTNETMSGKVALIHFWASWCSACNAEQPMLMDIKNVYGVPIYGIAFKDDADSARDSLNAHGNPYVMTGVDTNGDVGVEFGIYGTPETYVVNPDGYIIYKYSGVIDQSVWDNKIYPLIRKYQHQ
jgi:cytochrome c biogenesis protein CcmG/thiol:disulfide interchange protein DsbE